MGSPTPTSHVEVLRHKALISDVLALARGAQSDNHIVSDIDSIVEKFDL